jgi:hypothetical protein
MPPYPCVDPRIVWAKPKGEGDSINVPEEISVSEPAILGAMGEIPRERFVPEKGAALAVRGCMWQAGFVFVID